MSQITIHLEPLQAALLARLARRDGRAPEEVVHAALTEYLARHGLDPATRVSEPPGEIPEDEWQARFESILERIRADVPENLSPEEIDAEIDAAVAEVRRSRAGRRRLARER